MSTGSSVPYCAIPRLRAVNLGGWLVTEGWIKPSLFEGIPNKYFLDGALLQFKSVTVGKYLCAENGGGTNIVANRTAVSDDHWETFRLWRIDEKRFNFRVAKKQFVGLSKADGTRIVAAEDEPQNTEIFEIHINPNDVNRNPYNKEVIRVRIKASNGFFLQVKTEKMVTADYKGNGGWGDDNPSVFLLTASGRLQGEYQVTNGYGPLMAPQVMKEHWNKFIVEEDFKFIKNNGLNAVRIPVGWWIAYDPNPPKPYVGGSLQALDNAFLWADKYGIKVIVDLHAAPGSQSGWEPSSSRDGEEEWEPNSIIPNFFTVAHEKQKPHFSRDGFREWTHNEDHIQETIDVIDFLAARYAKRPSLFAVELLNEPRLPLVHLDVLIDFYKRGYKAVRKHSKTAYVVLCNRLGPLGANPDPTELLALAQQLPRSVIDVHYYNVFEEKFDNLTVQENIDYIKKDRADELKQLTKPSGSLIFVGEWVAEWKVQNATKEDYQRFAEAQLQVYGGATFGWSYWTLKNHEKHWSLEWMIKNGYIKLPPL